VPRPFLQSRYRRSARKPVGAHRQELAKTGFSILAVEPNIDELPPDLAKTANLRLAALDEAINEADIVVLLVDHKEFKRIPKAELLARVVVDTRGVWAGA
jgi:UDP-N-acetyl-D-mannosaminuronic acid dehydrogenase